MKIDKLEKLFTAIEVMSKPGGASMSELEKALKCNRKTIYRLKSDLDMLGIPYEEFPDVTGQTNSIRRKIKSEYLERYSGALIRLDAGERFLLTYLLKHSEILLDSSLSDMMKSLLHKLDKILICNTMNDAPSITVHNKPHREYNSISHELFRTFIDAVQNKTPLEVTYHSVYDQKYAENGTPLARPEKQFVLYPYNVLEYNGALYIAGKNEKYEDARIFALERFSRASTVKDAPRFLIPTTYNPDKMFESRFGICDDEHPIRPKLHFASWAKNAIYNRKWGDEQTIEILDDGTCILTFTTHGRYELTAWILSFGNDVKVLEPEDLRNDIVCYLQDALNQYE